jgi:hypothetical protein
MAEGVSDGSGRITWRNRWISMTAGPGQEPRHVTRPTAVITLPGLAGAAFIEVEPIRPIRAILPEPASVAGRVTLGGRPVDGRNARIRVVAAYQGRGVLDAALGREASAQADGRFELRGLTPGRYVVQAARDGIWLSKAVELAVAQGNDPPALALEIPDPGEPVRIELVDEKGRPFAHASIRSTRPEGPLALPPTTTVRADARGLATLRGLEAGRAPFQVEGLPGRYSLPVQAAGQGESPRVERVVILRPGP